MYPAVGEYTRPLTILGGVSILWLLLGYLLVSGMGWQSDTARFLLYVLPTGGLVIALHRWIIHIAFIIAVISLLGGICD